MAYDYSSTQIDLPVDIADQIRAFTATIPDDDLATDGREDAPHITVLYGLHTADADDVAPLLTDEQPAVVSFGPTSLFPASETGGDYDVVLVDVDSPDLERLNGKLADALPHTDTHPVYKPHATVSYIKAGRGKKYEGDAFLNGKQTLLTHLTFSSKDGTQTVMPLGQGVVAMSKLTAAQRRALPLEDFGQPDNRLFPIVDASDVSDAADLIGKAKDPEACKARIISIAKRKGFEAAIPDAWKEMAGMSAMLAASPADAQGMVRRDALISKAGDFPTHGWSITPDEMIALADAFNGDGYVEIQHFKSQGKASILDGHTGTCEGVWASGDGSELWGTLVLPQWLSDIADQHGGKVSGVFDRAEKRLKGVGLVLEPAVPEAAMLSAYVTFAARHDTQQGQYSMQRIHDAAVQGGATCAASNVGMASKHEASAIQQAHDIAVSHGATCQSMPAGKTGMPMMFSKQPEETRTMPDNKAAETTVADMQAKLDALEAQREADRKALVTLQAERRVEKADLWVDKLITENRVLPAERPLLVKLHVFASTDDDTSGLVTLADGGTESRLATLLAAVQARQKLGLTEEQLASNPKVAIMLNHQKTVELSAAETVATDADKDKLLEMTPLGRTALAARRRRAAGNE